MLGEPLVVVFIIVIVVPAMAWDEPSGFRDIPWGASREVVSKEIPVLDCTVMKDGCMGQLTIGEIRPRPWVTIMFEPDGGMDYVGFLFESESFDLMKEAFVGRYGEPTSKRTATLQNRMGATFQNEIMEWDGKRVSIDIRRYSSTATDGGATIQTKEGQRRRAEEFKEKAKSGKKDL